MYSSSKTVVSLDSLKREIGENNYNHLVRLAKCVREIDSKEPIREVLSLMFIDRAFGSHDAELSLYLTGIVHKLTEKPFKGDMAILKSSLEAIMQGVDRENRS